MQGHGNWCAYMIRRDIWRSLFPCQDAHVSGLYVAPQVLRTWEIKRQALGAELPGNQTAHQPKCLADMLGAVCLGPRKYYGDDDPRWRKLFDGRRMTKRLRVAAGLPLLVPVQRLANVEINRPTKFTSCI
ncbi:hypothetical protein J3458_011603 [Metarhizium acridum]|uniref:uncharacterized protein n=1 Tax=Metarhizium acridum TaxID=92637 RepID=UPI001C6B1BFA|nr:hypothetical protein J3458_020712 [Metarhizium acridum]KAG8413946.1 hypothetical protein J3458_011603 [Metarhizium acridum]